MLTRCRLFASVVALSLLALPAAAQEGSPVTLHGFASQGFLKSSANRPNSAHAEQGTFAFTEEAVSVTWQASPKFRVGVQLFANDLGAQGNHEVTFDWALGDYRWRDWLGVRGGRVKLPWGLYSTVVDADAARPEILQPDGVYSASGRNVTLTFDGIQVYGLLPLGGAGDLEYEAWVGTADIEGAEAIRRFLRDGANSLVPALRLSGTDFTLLDVEAPVDTIFGASLEWRPPVPGLRLRAGFNRGELDISAATVYSGFAGTVPVTLHVRTSGHIEQEYFLTTSVEYQRGPLRVSSEYYRQDFNTRTTVTGLPVPTPIVQEQENSPEGYYVQVAYRIRPRLQASAYYSELYASRDDHEGQALVQRGLEAHRGYQKDLAGTLRFDVTPHWLLKAEVHDIRGTQTLNVSEQPDGLAGIEKDWWLFVAKTTFHF